ncbi:LuxR C-terminal-related transcriptional regulator [Pseudonocardia saturnea]
MIESWPLTGRADELRLLDGLDRRPGGLVLAGAAGVGKTRLARETVEAAARRGRAVRWVGATSSAAAVPLGAFAPLVGDVGADPTRVLRVAAEAALGAPGPAGVLMAVDDAHLLDELSAALVHQLAHDGATMLLTLRSGEPAPDAITALWKDRVLRRLELSPLSGTDTTTLLEAVLDGPLEAATARRLWAMTRGNPLYLRQLVEGEWESGRIARTGRGWRWSGQPTLSPSLTELIRTRMGELTGPVEAVVQYLAFGEPLGAALLTGLTGPAAVEEAEHRGLVEVRPDRRRLEARLAHPLFGEITRAACGQVRARRVRGRLATALVGTGARRADDTLRRAVLALDSDLPPDPALLTRAAHRAAELLDAPLAERLARAAVAAGGGFEPAFTLATVLVGATHPAEAELGTLLEHARTDIDRVRAAVLQVTNRATMLEKPDAAQAALDQATAAVTDPGARSELVSVQAYLDAVLGRPVPALHVAETLLAEPGLSDLATAFACWAAGYSLGVLGRADELAEVVERGAAAAARHNDLAWLAVSMRGGQVFAYISAGYLREATALAVRCRNQFADLALPAVIAGILSGAVELATGRARTALGLLTESQAALEPYGKAGGWLYMGGIRLTQALAQVGDTCAARRAAIALDAASHQGHTIVRPLERLAHAWVQAADGVVSKAVSIALDTARGAAENGQIAHEMLALHTAVRFGDAGPAARLAELAESVDGPRAPAAATHAAALAAGDGAALHAASVLFETMGDLLAAADAAAHAALAHRRAGRRGSAHAAAARAERLAHACEGARTPALTAAAAPLPLTERQREILTLAVQGHSNRDIAARLVVSVRTVETHRYRACATLGTSDLDQIGALLRGD